MVCPAKFLASLTGQLQKIAVVLCWLTKLKKNKGTLKDNLRETLKNWNAYQFPKKP